MCQWQNAIEKGQHEQLNKSFYWPKMKKNIEYYVHICVKCQNTKLMNKEKYGLYKALPFRLIHIWKNFNGLYEMPFKVARKDAILVVVDKFPKLVKFEPIKTITIMTNTTMLFFDMWVRDNGMLEITINDHDGKFT